MDAKEIYQKFLNWKARQKIAHSYSKIIAESNPGEVLAAVIVCRKQLEDLGAAEEIKKWLKETGSITPDEITTLTERMAEVVHQQWMEKRAKEKGWHSPEECPQHPARNNPAIPWNLLPKDAKYCENCHPCMRPYADLPDSEKDLDRAYPGEFFKILGEMGYMVTKK
jgi:hypothetical protein